MNEELLKNLVDKYLTGTITDAGKAVLSKMIADPAYRPALESLMEQSFRDGAFKGEENPEMRAAVQEWTHQKINEKQKRTKIFRIVRLPAAACIIGLAGFGIWFMVLKNSQPAREGIAKTTAPIDFAPGKEGAILTLADGRQIILDSAANGSLTSQGGVSVNKNGGQVLYEALHPGSYRDQGYKEVVYNTMTTPKGRQYTVVLADGSRVLLNAASSIRFPTSFPGKERVVEITGEAYFEVAKDPAKKFTVMVGDIKTEVLGTNFTINSYTDEEQLTVTLLEGSIKVFNSTESTLLQPGGQAQISVNGDIASIKNANLENATGWINGYFYFNKANVQTVMRQLVRWYDIEVGYKGNVTRELFGGKIQRNLHLSAVMDILRTIGVKYKVEGKTLIIGS